MVAGVTTVARRSTATAVVLTLGLLASVLVVLAMWAAVTDRVDAAIDLGVAGLAAWGVAVLVAQMRQAPRISCSVTDGRLVVRFRAWDAVWTLRREVQLPAEQIAGVSVHHMDTLQSGWRRRRGTFIPGLIQAGSFGARDSRELWDIRAGADAVDVELAAPAPFRRVVLELPDPSAAADELRAAAQVRP